MSRNAKYNSTCLADAFPARDRKRVQISFENDPGKTEPHHAQHCDITSIIAKHVRSRTQIQIPESVFQDFTNLPDYQTALNTVMNIDNLFNSLPLNVRVAYDHNPAAFMAAVENPLERDKLVSLGVFNAKEGVPAGESAPAKDLKSEPTGSAAI